MPDFFDRDAAFHEVVGYVRRRLAMLLRAEECTLPPMPLGEMTCLVWLINGHLGATGHYDYTLQGLIRLFGRDMVWQEPAKPEKPEPEKVVIQ